MSAGGLVGYLPRSTREQGLRVSTRCLGLAERDEP